MAGSNVERIRHALRLLQGVMDAQSGEVRNRDIARITGLDEKKVRRVMDNNLILPRGTGEQKGRFVLDKRIPIGYKGGARGPSELDEEQDRGGHGIRRSKYPKRVPEDYSG